MPITLVTVLALDVGEARVGVAIASQAARLARPLLTLERDETFFDRLQEIIDSESISTIVVGLPRGLDGQHTAQTRVVEHFAEELRQRFSISLHLQDEAVTSKQAEAELQARGKAYKRGDIDALAATYILEDFLTTHQEKSHNV